MVGLAAQVRQWASTRPIVLEAMRVGIANLSAVARMATDDLKTDQTTAVLAALRRYSSSVQAPYFSNALRSALISSRIQTRSRVAIVMVHEGTDVLKRLADPVRQSLNAGLLCRIIQGTRAVVVNVDEDAVPLFTDHLSETQVISVRHDLAELAVTGPPGSADTRGLLFLVSGVLSANGFKIVQAIVSYTDVIFLLSNADVARAAQLLGNLLDDVSAAPKRFRRERRIVERRRERRGVRDSVVS
jgi:hypothetical protein